MHRQHTLLHFVPEETLFLASQVIFDPSGNLLRWQSVLLALLKWLLLTSLAYIRIHYYHHYDHHHQDQSEAAPSRRKSIFPWKSHFRDTSIGTLTGPTVRTHIWHIQVGKIQWRARQSSQVWVPGRETANRVGSSQQTPLLKPQPLWDVRSPDRATDPFVLWPQTNPS